MRGRRAAVTVVLQTLLLLFIAGCSLLNSSPTASFTFTLSRRDPPCVVDFDASSSHDPDGIIVKYEWSFGDGSSGSGGSTSHTYTTSGTYTIELKVTDHKGKAATKSETITVLPPYDVDTGAPMASFTASPTSGTAPLGVVFDASGSSDPDGHITSYNWDFGDGSTGTGVITSHTYSSTGAYTVKLTVTDNESATSSASQVVSVTTQPSGPLSFTGHGSPQSPPAFLGRGLMTFYMEHAGSYFESGEPKFHPFTVSILDHHRNWVELLVNETGNFDDQMSVVVADGGIYYLDIVAGGAWAITVFDNSPAPSPPQTYTGHGQELSQYSPLFTLERGPATFYYSGSGATNIVLLDYHRNWEVLLVDENESFDSRKIIEIEGYGTGTYLLKIRASGDWEVSVEQ